MTEVVHFQPEHCDELLQHLPEDDIRRGDQYVSAIAEKDSSWSLLDNGHLIFSCGIYPIWDGVGEAWFLPSEKTRQHKISTVKILLDRIDYVAERFNLQRVQATADCEIPRDKKFLELLDFKVEARMKRYGPTRHDFYLMARFF